MFCLRRTRRRFPGCTVSSSRTRKSARIVYRPDGEETEEPAGVTGDGRTRGGDGLAGGDGGGR